jgi:DHA2 family metal-tetracycline-proton antiporter-like MFS transporter/DHA2 family florfenicol/chloramphenicol resistance protein-like MFS transporter
VKISEQNNSAGGGQNNINTRLLLAVLICALFVSVFTNTMVNVAIPVIRGQFGASEAEAGWVITGYALTFAVSIPIYGRDSDLFSLKRTFAFGLAMLAVGLAVCALAPTLPVLVAGRALQGVGAGPSRHSRSAPSPSCSRRASVGRRSGRSPPAWAWAPPPAPSWVA